LAESVSPHSHSLGEEGGKLPGAATLGVRDHHLSARRGFRIGSKPVTITDKDLQAIQWLVLRVRDELVNFVPKFLGIEIEGIRAGSFSSLKVIESLVFESGAVWHLDEDDKNRIKKAIDGLRDGLGTQTLKP
jgi:hypothetical protein